MSEKRDYYEILGVARNAPDEDIRKAYRRLARQLHPDVNKATDAAKKFSEVQEAYDVLSDSSKRKAYDQFGHVGVGSGAGTPGPAGWGGTGPGSYTYTWSGSDAPSMQDIFGAAGSQGAGSIFEEIFGARGRGTSRGRRAKSRQPQPSDADVQHTIDIPFLTAVNGGKESIEVSRNGERGPRDRIDVTIPRGVSSGARLRLRGQGAQAPDGSRGDLLLTLNVLPHPWFRRDGLDIHLDLPLTFAEAALGTHVEVPTLRGKVRLRVPSGTSSGQKLRVAGQGIESAAGDKGDFIAVVQIVAPKDLTDEEKALLERIGARTAARVRQGGPWA